MSYDQMNVGGRCAPGIACPTPMALPSYTQACAPKIPMPIYQQQVMPQQQYGIVGGCSTYTPPPAVSYSPHYVCYNAGHQSYNQTLGTLSNIIIGAIYSTPMNGGSMPGQLATQGGSNPYAAYCPPGQDPNQYYQEQCLTNPPSYHPQPYPMPPVVGGGNGYDAGRSAYQGCAPCGPGAPKAYEAMFNQIQHKQPVQSVKKTESLDCNEWEGKVTGGNGTIKIGDRYEIKLDESKGDFNLFDKTTGKKIEILDGFSFGTDADGKLVFKEDVSFVLEDGTKITVNMKPTADGKSVFASELYITKGDKSMKVTGLGTDKNKDGKLDIVVSESNGKALDKLIDDGATTVYQVGGAWVNGANGKEITQKQIDIAEETYDADVSDEEAYKGSEKDDKIKGTSKDDRYIATDGEDVFDGLDGKDTAVFSGDLEDYEIVRRADGRIVVTDDDGNETTLKNVEFIEFNGKSYRISEAGADNNNDGLGKGNEERLLVFGKAGDDTYTVEEHAKTVYFDGGVGTDTVKLQGNIGDYSFNEGEGGAVIITDDNDKVIAVVRDTEFVNIGDKDYKISKLLDGDTTPEADPVVTEITVKAGGAGNETMQIGDLLNKLTGAVKTVNYSAGDGTDTIDLSSIEGIGEKYKITYNATSKTLTISDSDKKVVITNVEKIKIKGSEYTLSEYQNLTAINNLMKEIAGKIK